MVENRLSMYLQKTFILIVFTLFIASSCDSSDDKLPVPITHKCETTPKTIKQGFRNEWSRTVELPTSGKFVEESHYVTTNDFASGGWPSTKVESIDEHLQRSFQLYKKYNSEIQFDNLYKNHWQKEWTPEEGGHFGQGSVGEVQKNELAPEMEMWFMTMMWASSNDRPARGTKFLLQANGKSVVVIAGFETGPSSESKLGGVTPEVHKWLKTDNNSTIKVSFLKDQMVVVGPLNCN